ncbi:hypothetical protein L1049_005019 [Liquidambar formosana]|uniref:Uncharacterized protein n=1 Tax=Liquidambar formosana TaxID=63359 RepID=A0AAP0RTL6_LIQFO
MTIGIKTITLMTQPSCTKSPYTQSPPLRYIPSTLLTAPNPPISSPFFSHNGKKTKLLGDYCISKRPLTSRKMGLHFRPKPMSLLPFLCLFFLFLTSVIGDDTPSAYEVLEEYDFPIGILPKGVTGYELDNSTGEFSAYLNGSCSFTIDGYDLKYKSTITGVISTGKLKSLKGISVKVLFLWLSIVEVIRDGEELDFSVGIASADFPVDNFDECPQCGCGFDCVNGFVSSS